MSSGAKDEFDAARDVAAILEGVDESKRHQVIRWALEKLGTSADLGALGSAPPPSNATIPSVAATPPKPPAGASADIKSFIDAKAPKSQSELVATVAYYHQFEAPESQRQEDIGEKELLDACRLAQRHRPGAPAQVLVNACAAGLLDRVSKGRYRINSVGENLVAMVLPHNAGPTGSPAGNGGPRRVAKSKKATTGRKRS